MEVDEATVQLRIIHGKDKNDVNIGLQATFGDLKVLYALHQSQFTASLAGPLE